MTDTRIPTFAEEFGEHLGPSAFPEDGVTNEIPSPNSSATRHVARVRQQEQDAARQRSLDQLAEYAEQQADDDALDYAQHLIRQGRKVPERIRLRADRALERQDGPRLSTAEIHAKNALGRRTEAGS
jgi:hypothetical protein